MAKVSLGETLLPALVQCFGIICIGYILGRTKILRPLEARGLSIFVQYLSLPSLIFTTVSTMPFTEVKWEFLASVFVTKAGIFICVALISMLLTHPLNLGKSALFAIAATQSNDFALGYPLLVSLYQDTHPEYPNYLYIIAPIQLLILNTVGFFMLEIQRNNQTTERHKACHLLLILKDTLLNPVVIMTTVGLIWNVTYGQKILPIFANILKAFSSAFPAAALLLVGYTMTVRSEKQTSQISLLVLLLIFTKNLILPLFLQKCSAYMLQNSTEKEIESFSSFGFLYGTIPTAPTAYVFAVQYDTCVDAITKTIIGSTLFAAPLMFASASVISLAQIGEENITFYLSQTIGYVSIVNFVCCIWSIVIFWSGKRWRSISFGIIFYLLFAQFLMAVGGILVFFTPEDFTILFYIQYVLTNGSIYATRTCACLLAILLLTIRIRSLCFILLYKKFINIVSIIVCIVLPYAIAAGLMAYKRISTAGPNLQLGYIQIVTTVAVTFLCLTGTILCLILHQIYLRRHTNRQNTEHDESYYPNTHWDSINSPPDTCNLPTAGCGDIEDLGRNLGSDHCTETTALLNNSVYERICDSHYPCSAGQRIECTTHITRYISENNEIGTGLVDDIYFFKHNIVLILLSVAMTLSLFICFWKLVLEEVNGIFIELEFLDVIVNYSIGIVCFILFGLDTDFLKAIYKKLKMPNYEIETTESRRICEQFFSEYYRKCKKDIGQPRLIGNEIHYIFRISDLANWLMQEEVIQTIDDSEFFIECLLKGHIVKKLRNNDESLGNDLYKFVNDNLSLSL